VAQLHAAKGDAAEAVTRLKQQPGNYRLGDSVTTTTGVLVAIYRPTEPAAGMST
jgi:hypothetical protein